MQPEPRLYTLLPRLSPSPSASSEETPVFASNWAYRQYMTHHARDVMKHNALAAIQATGNNPYCNVNTGPADPQITDLRFSYWEARDRKARMFSPVVPHDVLGFAGGLGGLNGGGRGGGGRR